jgi:hypothetical protein
MTDQFINIMGTLALIVLVFFGVPFLAMNCCIVKSLWNRFTQKPEPIGPMRGYKGFDKDLCCCPGGNIMQYEVGKEYEIQGELRMCINGFHFCKKLSDVFYHYQNNGRNRFCEVEALGKIESFSHKFCTSKIRIIRELSPSEVGSIVASESPSYTHRPFGKKTLKNRGNRKRRKS